MSSVEITSASIVKRALGFFDITKFIVVRLLLQLSASQPLSLSASQAG
ncbi:MAG: hypothetical protein JF606_07225 [Burkholderiales bacterium]|jgi:hypothetical protein|nr:hypothetical protein [Burkholderiales bacterium]